ncbi:MAG: hypothetical protein HQL38_16920 [Alphaproteobacteria bacterium]|nr:hypothetical protein [Alphaproteobacteria bacterium]
MKLFQQYAIAFKGAKQLNWFGAVRKLYRVDDTSDREAADAGGDDGAAVAFIAEATYRELARRNLELALLRKAASGGLMGVLLFLEGQGVGISGCHPGDWRGMREQDIAGRRASAASKRRMRKALSSVAVGGWS